MQKIELNQIKEIHYLLPPLLKKDYDLKAGLIVQYTGDESKTSTKDLTKEQASELIHWLRNGNKMKTDFYAAFDKDNGQHKYVLSLCHEIGWVKYSPTKKRNFVHLPSLGAWLHKYGYLHKPLKDYTKAELPKLIAQLENLSATKKTERNGQ